MNTPLMLSGLLAVMPAPLLAQPASIPVSIQIDAGQSLGPFKPIWRFFGADEPNYATMKDGRRLIGELGALRPQEVYFRAHNLLTTGDGTPALKWGSTNAYTEDPAGKPVDNWTIVDHIFDTYLARGVRPYAQVGFMPEALSVNPEPYQHEWRPGMKYDAIGTGWAYIDASHSNAFAEWGRMGSPAEPNEAQYARLVQAGQLAQVTAAPTDVPIEGRTAHWAVTLPRQAADGGPTISTSALRLRSSGWARKKTG